MSGTVWKRGRLVVLLVLVLAVLCGLGARQPELPDSLGIMAAELRVGMSRDEAVDIIRTRYRERPESDTPRLYVHGRTHDGRDIGSYFDWELSKLPPADQIAWAELTVDDDCGRDLIIRLGPGGAVTRIRLKSDSEWEEWRYNLSSLIRETLS